MPILGGKQKDIPIAMLLLRKSSTHHTLASISASKVLMGKLRGRRCRRWRRRRDCGHVEDLADPIMSASLTPYFLHIDKPGDPGQTRTDRKAGMRLTGP